MTVFTATLYPGFIFLTFFVLNFFVWSQVISSGRLDASLYGLNPRPPHVFLGFIQRNSIWNNGGFVAHVVLHFGSNRPLELKRVVPAVN